MIKDLFQKSSWRVLSGSDLKMLAMVTMLIDHLAAFYWRHDSVMRGPLFMIGHYGFSGYAIMRSVGRIAFPIFCFLLVEGFLHTRSRRRYGLNMFLFALVSEVPWNLVHTGTLFCSKQNVFFTLLLGFLGMCAIERFRSDRLRMAVSLIGLFFVSLLLRADYGCMGYGFILLLYVLRRQRLFAAVIGSSLMPPFWKVLMAFIPIAMYNGKRGFIQGPVAKYAFYAFYPLHLFVIYLMMKYFYN